MKATKKLFAILVALNLVAIVSQAQNQALINNIEYDVTILNDGLCNGMLSADGSMTSETGWWQRNLESSKRWYLQQMIIKKALKGELKLYDNAGKNLSKSGVEALLNSTDTITYQQTEPPYKFHDTVLIYTLPAYKIKYLRFREKWWYDPKTYCITKEITEYAPVIENISTDKKTVTLVPLFWIKNSNTDKKNYTLLTEMIEYNSEFKKTYKEPPQLFNTIAISNDTNNRKNFIKSLFDAAGKNSVSVYQVPDFMDYYDYTIDKISPMTKTDLTYLTQGSVDSVKVQRTVPPYNYYDTVITVIPDLNSVKLLRCYEKWYIDKTTLDIKKEVLAIAPCEMAMDETNSFKGLKPLFVLIFGSPLRSF